MNREKKWTIITIIVLWISFIGFCYQVKAHEEMIPQSEAEMLVEQIDAIAMSLSPEFMEEIAKAKMRFYRDIDTNPTDMGIVTAQQHLDQRIDYILLKYESDRLKIEQATMDIDAERLQAEEEDRQLDQQGIWKEMTK